MIKKTNCICKRVILIDLIFKKNENCYPKVFLEKYDFNKDIDIYTFYYISYTFISNARLKLAKKSNKF